MYKTASIQISRISAGMRVNGEVVSSLNYAGGYYVQLENGSILKLGDNGRTSISVEIDVPDSWVDMSDPAYVGAPVIDGDTCVMDDSGAWHYDAPDGPVVVAGYYGYGILRDWPGVGPSTTPYKMKGWLIKGVVHSPTGKRVVTTDGVYCEIAVHRDSWHRIGRA